MGSNSLSEQLTPYGKSLHPIHGQIQAFYLKTQTGKFAMKITQSITTAQLQLIQQISAEDHKALLTHYGNDAKNMIKSVGQAEKGLDMNRSKMVEQINISQTKTKDNSGSSKNEQSKSKQEQVNFYWEYLNWDLAMETEHLKKNNQLIKEDTLWEIIDVALQASIFLKQHNVYLDFRPKTIQFTAGRQPKLYWLDILPNNLHRPYERYITLGQFRHTIYSPQELLQMCRTQRQQINKDKCTIFTLGLSLLQSIIRKDVKAIYNYNSRQLSEVKKREYLSLCKGKYSQEFESVLKSMLEYFAKDRPGFGDLQNKLDIHYGRGIKGVDIIFDSGIKRDSSLDRSSHVTFGGKHDNSQFSFAMNKKTETSTNVEEKISKQFGDQKMKNDANGNSSQLGE